MKRLFSILLVLVIVFGMVPANVFADQTQRRAPVTNVSDPAIIDNKNMTVTGTNHIGEMVSKDIQQEQAADAAALQNGYDVVSLTVENNAANVEFYAKDEASIVVAIYTEDRSQMISSSTVDVVADQTEVTLTLPDTLPQYFHASAYMVDKKDQRPLCSALHTTMYTKDMQELLSSTIYDYDPNLVVNLDGRTDTNFAVYNEDTVVVQEQPGTNTVVSSDENNLTYVIENPSQEIRSLMYGDVLSLPYGDEDILFIKVDRVTVSGTRATITGLPIEMQDVFSYVKIDGEAGAANAEVDTSNADEDVTFAGITEERPTRAIEGGSSATHTLTYNFYKDAKAGIDGKYGELSCQLNGSFSLKFSIGVKYYIAKLKQEFTFSVEAVGTFKLGVEGTGKFNIPLGHIAIPVFSGINVGFEPSLIFEVNGKAEVTINVTSKLGFCFTTFGGIKNISDPIDSDTSIEAEITVFAGFDLAPQLSIISPSVAKVTASLPIGCELTAKMTGIAVEGTEALAKNNHTCTACVDIALDVKFGMTIKMTLLDKSWLSWSFKILELKWRVMDAYYSIDHKEFGWDDCPYRAYPLTITVYDSNFNTMESVTVHCDYENTTLTTDSEGKIIVYLPKGEYTLTASKGDYAGSCIATVSGDSKTSISVILTGTVSGNVKWSLTESGHLVISGKGAIPSYSGTSSLPWAAYVDRVKQVSICNGVTGIGANVFQNHPNLKSVYIGDSVSSIDLSAFNGLNLSKFTVSSASNSYTMDQKGVLYSKNKTTLYKAMFPLVGSYDIPNTVTNVASKAFAGQTGISLIHFTGDAPSIASDAFSGITSEVLYCTRTTGWTQSKLQNYGGTIIWSSYDGLLGSGTFGNQLTWNLYNDGVLRISGTGDIPNYSSSINAPWYKYRESIKKVVLSNGITAIGNSSFYNCSVLEEITIPATVNRIGTHAFYNCSSLVDITIPKAVTAISAYTFYNCSSLTEISVPESVASIEFYAFYGCSSLQNIKIPEIVTVIKEYAFYNCSSLQAINLPNGITAICQYAFYNCCGLSELVIPAAVTTIGQYAFSECSSLITIKIRNNSDSSFAGLTIGTRAFANCTALRVAKISDSTIRIEENIFSGCGSLESISIPFVGDQRRANTETTKYPLGYLFGNTNYTGAMEVSQIFYNDLISNKYYIPTSLKTVIITGGEIIDSAFHNCSNLQTVVLPETATTIGDHAFSGCTNLQSFVIPTGVKTIGDYAFYGCATLSNFQFPSTLTYIGNRAFEDCSSLTSINIQENLDPAFTGLTIGVRAFANCTSLRSAKIPDSTIKIGENIFSGCGSLESISIPFTGNQRESNIDTYTRHLGYLFGTDKYTGAISVCESPQAQASRFFYIPASLKTVIVTGGENFYHAFTNCTNLQTVVLPATTQSIDSYAFYRCTGLQSIVIPANVESIDSYAFYGCTALSQIQLPSTLTSIDSSAFSGCTSLTEILLPQSLTTIGKSAFSDCTGITELTIPDSVSKIGIEAFYNCTSLITISLGTGVRIIGSNAFGGCTQLMDVHITDIGAWCKISFASNYANPLHYAKNLYLNGAPVTEVDIPTDVTQINGYAFYNCKSLTRINIHDDVTEIGHNAFDGCSALSSIIIGESITSVGSFAFSGCINITEITIPNSVTTIGRGAFSSCSSLTKATLSTQLSTIPDRLFANCTQLTQVSIPSKVSTIGDYAFGVCTNLSNITIPENVTSIYSSAFSSCSSLSKITFQGNAPSIGSNVFYRVTATAYYPAGNATWTKDVRQDYGGTITWVAYTPTKGISNSAAPVQEEELTVTEPEATIPTETVTEPIEETVAETAAEPESTEEAVKMTKGPKAIFQPAYTAAAVKSAKDARSSQRPKARTVTFDGLDAGAEYIFLSVVNENEENLLIYENLLYIDQLTADSSGTITVTYIPRISSDTVYEMVTGGAKSDIADATVTWPSLSDNGDIQFFSPTVTYNGTTLTEGVDYVMRGDISFSAGGNYTCYIEGIGNYVGTYLCVYTVAKLCSHSNYTILLAVSATCTESGKTQGKQCNQCGEIFEEQWEVPAYGHTLVTLKAVAATCTSSGKTAGSYCSKCGVTIVAQQKIPALGHKGDTFVVAPTCTASGYTVCICYTCGDTIFSDAVAATGHKYISKVTAPDCENSGYTTYTCSACGNSYVSDETEALGHSFTNGICKNCGIGDISYAQVTWSSLEESDDLQYFSPTVTYNGTTLTEGIDYILEGDITFTAGGSYTCYVVGIGNYIGSYTCVYTVEKVAAYSKGLTYALSSDGSYYFVTGIGTCKDTDVVIPAEYNELPVKAIGSSAFGNCITLTSVTIPDSVTSIYSWAFYNCSSLQHITIPESVTEIGAFTFNCCSSLQSITIPDSVITLESRALFYDCTSLQNVIIPDNVTSIDYQAFYNCSSLQSFTIPDSVTNIGAHAFNNCSNLQSVTISNSVTTIGMSAFYGCKSLQSISIPDSVTTIGEAAFYNCTSLTSITIPSGVTSIENSTFYYCRGLTSITIPDTVNSIGNKAFYDCSNLTSITIPDSVTSIGQSAFYECRNLTSITLGNSVAAIKNYTFQSCSKLTSITIPDSVTSIGNSAFYNCRSLTSITIPDSVTSIGNSAFYDCRSLTSITIPDSVTSIEYYTFEKCTKLTSIRFEGDAPTFGSNVFANIKATAYYPADNETWTDAVKQNYGGTITWVPFTETAVKQWNLTVSDNIGVNFYITVNAADVDSTVVEITVDDVTVCCPVSNATQTGNANEYRFSAEISAAQMTQPITVCVITDGLTVVQKTYTVREYAQYILDAGNDFDAGTKALVREMLNYGAMAQIYFGYDTDNLPNEGITNVAATDVPKNMEEATIRDNIDSLNFYGASLVYQDRIAVRYYFTGDVTGLTFTANGNTYSPAVKDEMYYIEIADITPQDLDLQITLTATDADGNMLTVAYSPINYIVRMTQKGDENTRNLMKALYNYHLVAKSLFVKDTVARWNLTLEDDLKVKFYLNLDENESVKITVGDISNTYAATDLEKSDDAKHIVSVNISAAQMMDDITVQLVGRYDMKSYSIRQYCDTILADESHSQYHALVKEMLHYGAMAQLYFGYDTENLANDGITGTAAMDIPETAEELTVSDMISGLSFYGASLVYRDRIAVRYYFTGDVTGCTFIANGKIYTPVEKDGMHYVEIADILPQDLDQQITLTVTDTEGNILSVTYGPMNYIVRMNVKGSDNLKNLLKALYNYHLTAKRLSETSA